MKTKLAKIAVSKESEEGLERMMKIVNEGYSGGRVGKAELASWIFLYFEKKGLVAAVDVIRAEFFDQVQYLGNVVKELKSMRRSGTADIDIQAMLAPVVGRVKRQKDS